MEYIAFILLGFSASLVSAVFGFGTALIALSLGSYILPVKEAIVLATVLFTFSTISKSVLFAKFIDWKMVAIMSIASLPFALLGALAMGVLPSELLRKLLGLMILIYVVIDTFKVFPKIAATQFWLVIGSAVYGFFSGLLGSGNIVKVALFQQMHLKKEAFVGAMAATSVIANCTKLVTYHSLGMLNQGKFWPSVGLAVAAISAALVGKRFIRHVSISQFDMGIRVILAISAIGLVI